MSVTFFMPDAPTEKYEPYPDEPGYMEERPVAPFTELNMANSNAVAILAVIDPGADYTGGRWEGEKLERVFKRTMKALNRGATVSSLTLPARQEGNFYEGGRDVEYVTRRLTEMAELLRVAIQHRMAVNYG